MTKLTGLGASAKLRLQQHNLAHWVDPCEVLLRHFTGLEEMVIESPEEAPLAQIQKLIGDVTSQQQQSQAQLNDALLEGLKRLPLFYYRAHHGQAVWNPLEMPLSRFAQIHGHVACWEETTPYPEPEAVGCWLIQRLGGEPSGTQ